MVLLSLHQSSGISQAVALLEDCHIPQQLPTIHENGVGNLDTGEGCEWDGVGGVWGCAKAPLVLYGVLGVSSLESTEVEGDLTGVGPERWHSHPAVMSCGVHMGMQRSDAVLDHHLTSFPKWFLYMHMQLACSHRQLCVQDSLAAGCKLPAFYHHSSDVNHTL